MASIIGIDFGNINSFPAYISGINEQTNRGGVEISLLPAKRSMVGISSSFHYKNGMSTYGDAAAIAVPKANRRNLLKRRMGTKEEIDGSTIRYDEVITAMIKHIVDTANDEMEKNYHTQTNSISLAYPVVFSLAEKEHLRSLAEKAVLANGENVKVEGMIQEPAAASLISLRDNIQADLQSHGMLSIGATRMQARQLFEGAMAYRANVYADQREWQLRQAAAQQSVSEAMIDLDASRHIEVDDMDIDVDYWTCGDLHRIEEQLQQLQSLAQQPGTSNSDLEHIGQLAETYRQEIQRAVQFAMQARQFSFDRKELLEEAVSHIAARFGTIRPEWEEYFAGDERFGYRVYLTAPSGERLVLTAEPVSNAQGEGDIRNQFRYDILSVGNSIHNSQEARAFMQDLERALQDLEGCRFTTASCTNTAAPAQDNGQSDHQVWRNPTPAQVQTAAQRATPTPAAPRDKMPPTPATFKPRSSV